MCVGKGRRFKNTRLAVICDAAGVAPQLGRVANPFGVALMSGGGFGSITDKEKFARQLIDHHRPTDVLHIGDHDPTGVDMFLAFLEDVQAFTREFGGQATLNRLAVTPAQIVAYSLPTAPANGRPACLPWPEPIESSPYSLGKLLRGAEIPGT
jgi:hypothetical protein